MKGTFSPSMIFSSLNVDELARLLSALLLRRPIIVIGENGGSVDLMLEYIASFAPHRDKVIFGIDFITTREYEEILRRERQDLHAKRVVIVCPCRYVKMALEKFSDFKGWVLGVLREPNNDTNKIVEGVFRYSGPVEVLYLSDGVRMESLGDQERLYGFERQLIENAIVRTHTALSRMRKVIRRRIRGLRLDTDLSDILLDFSTEETMLKEELLRNEVLNFVHAARRALILLYKLRILNNVGMRDRISDRTLLQTILYPHIDIAGLLEFIRAEWGEDFGDLISKSVIRSISDWIDSLW
ncbi:MAG: hypothetical protein ACTSXJ_02060 [Candidatus Baldrarchaeia archaeon]